MPPLTAYIESTLGTLLTLIKSHDAKLLSRLSPATSTLPPTITVSSPELSSGKFTADKHELLGQNIFPSIHWQAPDESTKPQVQSWLLVVEDADPPLWAPIVHGVYYDLGAGKTSVRPEDLEKEGEGEEKGNRLRGGFRYGVNRRGTVWTGPRPVLGHGEHRYFFQVFGLNVEVGALVGKGQMLSKEMLLEKGGAADLEGKVLCWGEMVASFERRL